MHAIHPLSRRGFMGGLAAALGYLGLTPGDALAQGAAGRAITPDQYDAFAKLSSNENYWGPPESVMKAMTNAWKYSNRYGYPDGNLVDEIAKHHGVKPENILLGAGSGEILDVVGTTFLLGGKKVLGVEPTYSSVYPARDEHQGRRDQAAARQGLPPEHPGADHGDASELPRRRLRVPVQPEQPDRPHRHEGRSEAAARRHSEGHAGARSTRRITTSSTIRTTRRRCRT